MRTKSWLLLLVLCLLVGCKQKTNCRDYADRQLLCAGKIKDKAGMRPLIWNFCHSQLNQQKTQAEMKQKLLCLKTKTCKVFKQCHLDVKKKFHEGLQDVKVGVRLQRIKKWNQQGNAYKAQHECTNNEEKESTGETQSKSLLTFHQYCLERMPVWLKSLSQKGSKHTDFQACYDSTYLHRAKANLEQSRAIKHACIVLQFSQKYRSIKKKRKKYLSLHQFPWQCDTKEAKPLLSLTKALGQRWLKKYQKLCYQDIGIKLLQHYQARVLKSPKKYCGYYPQKVMQGFRRWKMETPAQQSLVEFFKKLCKEKQ